MERVVGGLIFWGVWLLVPLIVDFTMSIVAVMTIFIHRPKKNQVKMLEYFPEVSVIVPVYNSADSLKKCIESIINQKNYPMDRIEIILVDNGSTDNSREVFYDVQNENLARRFWYLDSEQGKSNALNKGLYISSGKYVINIDSDGVLDENAIHNLIYKFEEDPEIDAMTGVILTDINEIEKSEGFASRIFRRCELFEYMESFLIGRAYEGRSNKLFTMAGACSAFRKETVMQTSMYNGETLGEDTHMTVQIRDQLGGKVALCENAYFFVEPIESLDKLYIQRQRWQRGQIEVSALFNKNNNRKKLDVLKRHLIKDHTMMFPRLIWLFAIVYLILQDYPMRLIIGANLIMYVIYAIISVMNLCVSKSYIDSLDEFKKYINKHILICFIMPLYRMLIYIIRFIGTINSATNDVKWNAKTFTQERGELKEFIDSNSSTYVRIKKWINGRAIN